MSSDKQAEQDRPRKGKGWMMKLLVGVVLIGVGGGGAIGLMQAGFIPGASEEKQDNRPKLVLKGEEDPFAPPTKDKESEELAEVHGEGGSKYRTSYYSFAEDFTSNLKHSDALIQVSLAASTRRDGRVLMWMRKHELAIRSALLAILADTPEEDVYTLEGKQRLQARLTRAINQVLVRNEGFGGVDAVYFRSFVIQ
ncbi:MAG: flagellar basal body-associated FliL family protein [Novosphingobium sp.]|nr:flagellar basal body-associated FliL family protein [Novosphingobium sp.]